MLKEACQDDESCIDVSCPRQAFILISFSTLGYDGALGGGPHMPNMLLSLRGPARSAVLSQLLQEVSRGHPGR